MWRQFVCDLKSRWLPLSVGPGEIGCSPTWRERERVKVLSQQKWMELAREKIATLWRPRRWGQTAPVLKALWHCWCDCSWRRIWGIELLYCARATSDTRFVSFTNPRIALQTLSHSTEARGGSWSGAKVASPVPNCRREWYVVITWKAPVVKITHVFFLNAN